MIFFNRVVLKDVLLKDQHSDTILFAPSMVATLKKLKPSEKIINLSRLKFEFATVRVAMDTAKIHNLKFIVDALRKPPDSTRTEKWMVNFEAIDFNNSRFLFEFNYRPREVTDRINFTDLCIEDMDLNIHGFRVYNDTVRFSVDHLSFREKSGFPMEHLEAEVYIGRKFFLWRDVRFNTRRSDVAAERLDFKFGKWQDFGNRGFPYNINLYYSFNPSLFHYKDLAYFSNIFRDIDQKIRMSGNLRGRINSFKGDHIVLEYGENSHFSGSFDLIGLPDAQETYMYFDIEDLTTSVADIESFQIPGAPGKTIDLSDNLSELGNISYRGKYAGFYNDFVTYGSFTTDLGNISSDLSIRPDADENVHFRGEISTEGFDLGRLRDLEHLAGKLSMEGNVEGISYHGGDLSATMDGNISLLEFNAYPYNNIALSGDLSDRKFDGSFSVADPNLRMEFFGKIDFTDSLPVFDFTANVDKAMLHPLNIVTTDPDYILSCYLRANFIGDNLNDFNGEINLVNSLFQKRDKQIQMYDFRLIARHRPDSNQMILRSDLVDAEITGFYEFEDIGKATGHLLAHHLPSFRNIVKAPDGSGESRNNFNYSVHFKNTFPITDFFYPEVDIAPDSRISGNYHPAVHEFSLYADFPSLRWKHYLHEGLAINLASDDSTAKLETASRVFEAGSRIKLENLNLAAYAVSDEFRYNLNFDNKGSERLNLGNISGKADLQYREKHTIPRIMLRMDPGEVIVRDTSWHLAASEVIIDSSEFRFDDFRVSHEKQILEIEGIISENPGDRLNLSFSNLNLAQLNDALNGMQLSGIINGSSTVSGIYDNPVFLSDLRIDSLNVNGELLGNTYVRANWINPEQKIKVDMEAMRGELVTLALEGDYIPDKSDINFEITLNKLKINVFQPYLSGFISELDGISSGSINLAGTLDKPVMNGEVSIQKTSFMLDYLQTQYSFSDKVRIADNKFLLEDFEVFDANGSRAILNGAISTDYLRNPEFDLNLEADNFNFLNTREVHNQMYYGDANASGRVGLTGRLGNLRLFISARTDRGTHIFIPINQGRDIQENNFITFIQPENGTVQAEPEEPYSVDLGGFELDFQLEVTEDATTEIIFDPQVGDILQGNGNGNIQFSIDPQNGFQMYGDYTIERGDYLFTLQNIINKRLNIQRGGTIVWSGDPTSALINIKAVYNAKAAPGTLNPDPNLEEHLKKRMPVECLLIMEGNLLRPLISFDIVLPTAEEETKNFVRNAITTDEELTKQFLSLLVINNFISISNDYRNTNGGTGAGMAGVTASELLSNQLSNWLSQISNEFDIGVNYRPGDEISTDQVEVALSTQILDDRVSIRSNVGYMPGGNPTRSGQDATTIAGDFDVEVKLTDNGRLLMKAYNRYNHDQLYKTSPYTQGVGFVYREEFNNLGELGKRYSDALTGKNRRKRKQAKPPNSPNDSNTGTD